MFYQSKRYLIARIKRYFNNTDNYWYKNHACESGSGRQKKATQYQRLYAWHHFPSWYNAKNWWKNIARDWQVRQLHDGIIKTSRIIIGLTHHLTHVYLTHVFTHIYLACHFARIYLSRHLTHIYLLRHLTYIYFPHNLCLFNLSFCSCWFTSSLNSSLFNSTFYSCLFNSKVYKLYLARF